MWHAVAEVQKDVYISLRRELKRGAYDDHALRELDALLPSLRVASRMALLTWKANFSGRLTAFESFGRGALLLDRRGTVLEMNSAVKLGDGLDVTNNHLTASSHTEQKRLGSFLAGLLTLNDDVIVPKPSMLVLPRLSGARPRVLDGIGQPQAVRSLHSAAVALIVITDLELATRPPLQILSALFGLTRTEAQLAIHLCAGESLRCSADKLSITEGYARQRLKVIFQKTSTRRQGELMTLLGKLSRP